MKWGINIQPFGSGSNAVKYLDAYVKRAAIGDRRIVSVGEEGAIFLWEMAAS